MRKPSEPIKTDLVIGMTLAEIFLLILFIVWYSQGTGSGTDWKKIAADQLREIDQLKATLATEREKVSALEKIRDWWRANFSTDQPMSLVDIEDALKSKGKIVVDEPKTISTRGGKSNLTPTCKELGLSDVLFTTVISGSNSYEVNGQSHTFDQLLARYDPDLRTAAERGCRYSINVSYGPNVGTVDYVRALRRLRSRFYARLIN